MFLTRYPGKSQTIQVATTVRSQSLLTRKITKFLTHTIHPIPHHTCNASTRDACYRDYHVQNHAFIMPRLPLPALRTLYRRAASLDRRFSATSQSVYGFGCDIASRDLQDGMTPRWQRHLCCLPAIVHSYSQSPFAVLTETSSAKRPFT